MGLFGEKKEEEKDTQETKTTEKAVVKTGGEKKKEAKSEKVAYRVLVKPLVTEKVANLGMENKYAFEVAVDANKIEVAKAIKEVYGETPKSVNIIRVMGKQIRRGRVAGKRKDWKKAIVTMPEGKTISVYEGV